MTREQIKEIIRLGFKISNEIQTYQANNDDTKRAYTLNDAQRHITQLLGVIQELRDEEEKNK